MRVIFALGFRPFFLLAGWLAIARVTRSSPDVPVKLAPVSVLKPLNGADEDLYENLRSFFEQDLPELELVFGVTNAGDPALPIVARLQREFPHVPCLTIPAYRGPNGMPVGLQIVGPIGADVRTMSATQAIADVLM